MDDGVGVNDGVNVDVGVGELVGEDALGEEKISVGLDSTMTTVGGIETRVMPLVDGAQLDSRTSRTGRASDFELNM